MGRLYKMNGRKGITKKKKEFYAILTTSDMKAKLISKEGMVEEDTILEMADGFKESFLTIILFKPLEFVMVFDFCDFFILIIYSCK